MLVTHATALCVLTECYFGVRATIRLTMLPRARRDAEYLAMNHVGANGVCSIYLVLVST
jgi:hypothetical protein